MADRAAVTPPAGENIAWRRKHAGSGLTSKLILAYVERTGGRDLVDELLARAGLSEHETELRDENAWFSFETKTALWDAAVAVTGDPDLPERVGESALEFRIGLTLKRALRALGSPDFVYRNIVRANSKLSWAHSLEVAERRRGRVRLVYRDISGVGYERHDCSYTVGLLRMVPQLFGLPPARIVHRTCGALGDDHCEFDVHWTSGLQNVKRVSLVSGAAAAGVTGIGAARRSAMLAGGVGLGLASAAAAGASTVALMRRRVQALERRVRDQDLAAEAQLRSLAVLSSEVRLDEVLERITTSATMAIGGAQFALLVVEAGHMRADRYSDLTRRSLRVLERWAQSSMSSLQHGSVVIDDLSAVADLRSLAEEADSPCGSMCAAPMVFRERLLGVLIALSRGTMSFLPQDVRALETYAGHAAIALSNAQLVEQLEREAAEDPLTGLSNKRVFELACRSELARAERDDSSVSLVILDVDHFKEVNDTYGHPFGDQVLIAVAEALRRAVRGHDTVARLGGEEFALLLPDVSLEKAWDVAERARELLEGIELPSGRLSSSAGVASIQGGRTKGYDLLVAADQALYRAKREGRGRTAHAELPD